MTVLLRDHLITHRDTMAHVKTHDEMSSISPAQNANEVHGTQSVLPQSGKNPCWHEPYQRSLMPVKLFCEELDACKLLGNIPASERTNQ